MRLRGLYVLTDTRLTSRPVLGDRVEAALRGGARLVQYRNKDPDDPGRAGDVGLLLELCRPHGVPVIVNDDVELARRCHAHGVHLGRDDTPLHTARERLGLSALIGVSCYDEFDRAVAAVRAGADYVAFGSFFPSPTKPHAVRADPTLLHQARKAFDAPICAIGGIDPANAPALIEAGADLLAVVSAVWKAPDVETAARKLAGYFRDP